MTHIRVCVTFFADDDERCRRRGGYKCMIRYDVGLSATLVPQMPQSHQRMVPKHPRSAPSHHFAHLLPHRRVIAVNGAPSARWLAGCQRTSFEPGVGILLKSPAVTPGSGGSARVVMFAAIERYHCAYGAFFARYPSCQPC